MPIKIERNEPEDNGEPEKRQLFPDIYMDPTGIADVVRDDKRGIVEHHHGKKWVLVTIPVYDNTGLQIGEVQEMMLKVEVADIMTGKKRTDIKQASVAIWRRDEF